MCAFVPVRFDKPVLTDLPADEFLLADARPPLEAVPKQGRP